MRGSRYIGLGVLALIAVVATACGGSRDEPSADDRAEFRIGLVYFAPEEGADSALSGLFDGLAELGIEEGRNLEVERAHAQGEIANIPLLIQSFDGGDVDLIVTLTTPCLTAACTMARNKPVVFTYVYDPIAAGAGDSAGDHLPNITGVGSFPPITDTVDLIQRLVPGVTAVGTVYNSSEANSRKAVAVAREEFAARGIELREATVVSTGELFQATQAVAGRDVQALWITGDNTAIQGFDGIVKVATDAGLPLIINDPEFTERGALACVGIGWYQSGHAAASLVARVLRGESPAEIPFQELAVKKLVLNHEVAERLGITFPEDLLAEAEAR
ncbi:MAG: ABC transporter substrate-binding protein [Thermoanaerobaculia bacterium]|nr:ABC transporter substrate-binding protein [Thermoanaerobaculia bacterium]